MLPTPARALPGPEGGGGPRLGNIFPGCIKICDPPPENRGRRERKSTGGLAFLPLIYRIVLEDRGPLLVILHLCYISRGSVDF